jgi:hypothetical protein
MPNPTEAPRHLFHHHIGLFVGIPWILFETTCHQQLSIVPFPAVDEKADSSMKRHLPFYILRASHTMNDASPWCFHAVWLTNCSFVFRVAAHS